MTELHLVTFEVLARPASYSTANERGWKDAVRAAVDAQHFIRPIDARFAVAIDFRLAVAKTANEVWDLDNLIKPTLDAMEGVFGERPWRGRAQAADDRVDRLRASKRHLADGESPGATVTVLVVEGG